MKRLITITLFLLIALTNIAQYNPARRAVKGNSVRKRNVITDVSVSKNNNLGVSSNLAGSSVNVEKNGDSDKTKNKLGVSTETSIRDKEAVIYRPMINGGRGYDYSYKDSRYKYSSVMFFREAGSLAMTTEDVESSVFDDFKPKDFNDAVPDEVSLTGPVGDAILPMMLLLGLVIAYKRYKKN